MDIYRGIANNIKDFQSYGDFKKSELFSDLNLDWKIMYLIEAPLKFTDKKDQDQITIDFNEYKNQRDLNKFGKELIEKLNNFENPTSKFEYLTNLHTQLKIETIAIEAGNNLEYSYSIELLKLKVKLVGVVLEESTLFPAVSLSNVAMSNNENNIISIQGDEIDKLAKSLTAKIVLLYELGVFELLKKRIEESVLGYSRMNLARLIGHVIGVENFNYINDYLTFPDLDPFCKNYSNPKKDNPFTGPAVKEMKRILRECNLEPIKEYKEKTKPNITTPKKK